MHQCVVGWTIRETMLSLVIASAYSLPCQRTARESSEMQPCCAHQSDYAVYHIYHNKPEAPELGTPCYKGQNVGPQGFLLYCITLVNLNNKCSYIYIYQLLVYTVSCASSYFGVCLDTHIQSGFTHIHVALTSSYSSIETELWHM